MVGNEENNQQATEDQSKNGRKEARQISFRVTDIEYGKLQQTAETFQMSVPAFVKKKAQGAKLVTPKFDKESGVQISRELRDIGNNVNQMARWCNQRREIELQEEEALRLEKNIKTIQEELNRLWRQLS